MKIFDDNIHCWRVCEDTLPTETDIGKICLESRLAIGIRSLKMPVLLDPDIPTMGINPKGII